MSHSNYHSNGARDAQYKTGERYAGQNGTRRPNGAGNGYQAPRKAYEGPSQGGQSRYAHDSPEDWQDMGQSKNSVRLCFISPLIAVNGN